MKQEKLAEWPDWIKKAVAKNHPPTMTAQPKRHTVAFVKEPEVNTDSGSPERDVFARLAATEAAARLDNAMAEAAANRAVTDLRPAGFFRRLVDRLSDGLRKLRAKRKVVMSDKIKVRIVRTCHIAGQHAEVGSVWEVDLATFKSLKAAQRIEVPRGVVPPRAVPVQPFAKRVQG